jgi:hypothetical protein
MAEKTTCQTIMTHKLENIIHKIMRRERRLNEDKILIKNQKNMDTDLKIFHADPLT